MTDAEYKSMQDRCDKNAHKGRTRLQGKAAPAVVTPQPPAPTKTYRCPSCQGHGSRLNNGNPFAALVEKCTNCDGTGICRAVSTEAEVATESAKAEIAAIPVDVAIVPTTDEAKLNKTEKARLYFLEALRMPFVGVQSLTLKLGHDLRFTPDFWYVDANGKIVMEDVKGFMRDDARVKIYACARKFLMFKFLIVKKSKNGWDVTEVKP